MFLYSYFLYYLLRFLYLSRLSTVSISALKLRTLKMIIGADMSRTKGIIYKTI